MPATKYINFSIDGQPVDVSKLDEIPISISYKLEDKDDFQQKTSGDSFDITVPATINNDKIGNTFHNPGVEDMTIDERFRRPRKAVLEVNSLELLTGKAFLQSATHKRRPVDYTYDLYGDNSNWMIDLKESTFYDFLKYITFIYTKALIETSWTGFDGFNAAWPFVFAPVRYGPKMDTKDDNIKPEYLKPAISFYFLIYQAFKSIGYRVSSNFFDTNYFRRLVMPWTFGSFLYSEGTSQDNLKFNAKSAHSTFLTSDIADFIDLAVSNDNVLPGYDTNNVYTYEPSTGAMNWTYSPAFSFGVINATFQVSLLGAAVLRGGSSVGGQLHWFKNGVEDTSKFKQVFLRNHTGIGREDLPINVDEFASFNVSPGDVITLKVQLEAFGTGLGSSTVQIDDVTFTLAFTKYVLGSTIDFSTLTGLKNYNFLDFLRGVCDLFNLQMGTDAISKIVYFEPAHPYSLTADVAATSGGYFNGHWYNWNGKQDLSKTSKTSLYSEGERELFFKFKDDTNDGLLKIVQDRNKTTLAQAKYVLPDRFKAGKKAMENRFFSPVVHFEAVQWKSFTGTAPYIICLIPENISNTSESEAQNTFAPKAAWYAGVKTNLGFIWDGDITSGFPYMFAVDYTPGGQNNPILSYSDERIGTLDAGYTLGVGLLRRFYLQRMAMIRNGVYYDTWLKLNNFDVTNQLHREHKIVKGQKWELQEIKYAPLSDESTAVSLKKWAPVLQRDRDNCFPSNDSVMNANSGVNPFDLVYKELKALATDIPTK